MISADEKEGFLSNETLLRLLEMFQFNNLVEAKCR